MACLVWYIDTGWAQNPHYMRFFGPFSVPIHLAFTLSRSPQVKCFDARITHHADHHRIRLGAVIERAAILRGRLLITGPTVHSFYPLSP